MTHAIASLAASFAASFEKRHRQDGTSFVALKRDLEEDKEWMQDLLQTAHGLEMLPDDFRYEVIYEAALAISESDDYDEEDALSFADEFVGRQSNKSLIYWLASHSLRAFYCDQACDEGLASSEDGIIHRIAAGQLWEVRMIYQRLYEALEERLSDYE
ncbi:MAG: hypothetical protein QXM15_04735 [Archaeoglobaceae archaeon]